MKVTHGFAGWHPTCYKCRLAGSPFAIDATRPVFGLFQPVYTALFCEGDVSGQMFANSEAIPEGIESNLKTKNASGFAAGLTHPTSPNNTGNRP